MDNTNDIGFVKKVFEHINKSENEDDIKVVFDKPGIKEYLEKYRMDTDAYPRIKFTITPDEIRALKNDGVLNKLPLLDMESNYVNPLTKLMYAVLWKNGDLKKIKHIINGVLSSSNSVDEQSDALVFYQFGKYLAESSKQPIIDQHVIRAFAVYTAKNEGEISEMRKLGVLSKKHKTLIDRYKEWIDEYHQSKGSDFLYYLDQLLFATGKAIKFRTNGK